MAPPFTWRCESAPLPSSSPANIWLPFSEILGARAMEGRGARASIPLQNKTSVRTTKSEQPKCFHGLWGHWVYRLITTQPLALHLCHPGFRHYPKVRKPGSALLPTKSTHPRVKGIIVFLAISVKSLKSNSRQEQAVICVHREPRTKALFVLWFLYLQEKDPELNIMRESSKGFVLSCQAVWLYKSPSNCPGLGKSRAKKVFCGNKELSREQDSAGPGKPRPAGGGGWGGVDPWRSDLWVLIALAALGPASPGFHWFDLSILNPYHV